MEKIITIDCKQVKFKTNGAFLFAYKSQFKRDALKDIFAIQKAMGDDNTVDLEALDFDVFFNLAWTLAKMADKSIPTPIEWLEGFDEFPILDILPELLDLLLSTLTTTVKKN